MGEREKYQGYRRSFEGLESPFSSKPASDTASWCQRLARSPGTLCADDATFCKWSRPVPPLRAACRAGVSACDTVGGERCGTRTLVSIGDVSPIAVFVSGSVLEG